MKKPGRKNIRCQKHKYFLCQESSPILYDFVRPTYLLTFAKCNSVALVRLTKQLQVYNFVKPKKSNEQKEMIIMSVSWKIVVNTIVILCLLRFFMRQTLDARMGIWSHDFHCLLSRNFYQFITWPWLYLGENHGSIYPYSQLILFPPACLCNCFTKS